MCGDEGTARRQQQPGIQKDMVKETKGRVACHGFALVYVV